MKKLLCIVLSLAILFSAASFAVKAEEKPVPSIVITGFGMLNLYVDYATENEREIWPLAIPDVILKLIERTYEIVPATFDLMLTGDPSGLGKCVTHGANDLLPEFYLNPDGSDKGNVSALPNDPEIANLKYLNGEGKKYASDSPFTTTFDQKLNDWLAQERGAENVFQFQYDFRMGVYDISSDLDKFVKDILEYTGAEKVDIFAMSYGGLICGTYLSRYCTQNESKIRNAVLSVPALRGASMAKDFLAGTVDIPLDDAVKFMGSFLGLESNLSKYLADVDSEKLSGIAAAFMESIREMPLYWISIWDMLPPEDYNELKATLLDSVENAEIIRKSDFIHNEIMPNYTENFNKCRELGTNISIICNTGSGTIFGKTDNADIMVHARSGSGAVCSSFGKRFADGYAQKNTVCTNENHNHVSPSMEIDVSCGYLPENTWFVDGQFHSMYSFEEYSFSLVKKLLTTNTEINIYSDPKYPQFEISSLPAYGVYAKFDNSPSGYVSDADTALSVTNIHTKYPIMITDVYCNGMDLTFANAQNTVLAPGETVKLDFSGELKKVSGVYASVTVEFVALGSSTPDSSRVFDITICNGERVANQGGEADLTPTPAQNSIIKRIQNILSALFSIIFKAF